MNPPSSPGAQPPWPPLPRALAERTLRVGPIEAPVAGDYVLYWMRAALRAEENPALEVALALSHHLDVPVFVYHGLSERYPFASDRHHTFILEGARDVAEQLADRGIGTAFHLEREGHRGPHLRTLAQKASVVVTEDLPVAPLRDWTRSLAQQIPAPVQVVDTACLVPMQQTPWPFERAFEYRRSTAALRRERLGAELPRFEPKHPATIPMLPFEPVDLGDADFAALLADCAIDHTVAPVATTRGGTVAGMERWRAFQQNGLKGYHRRRNNALVDGVSRMSPYLHYGMVSPFRIAREAAEQGSAGAEKYLDELLIWREMAYAYCWHQPRHATVEALPEWARRTLAQHEADPRPALPSWERLARGETGDALWDAAQLHLLRQGELHNNVRMTWGKALLGWTRNAEDALRLLEDLNHRYALDGRDPASYGGILWCLGAFDRPFQPESPILGVVRPRLTDQHARRLDPQRYRQKTAAPAVTRPPKTLVVGAGMAGLQCARTLADAGWTVEVLDKGRGYGGRLSTRRISDPVSGETAFDHGAQYFTARDPRFRHRVASWQHDGVVERWEGRIGTLEAGGVGTNEGTTERWVAVPGMSALGRFLAKGLTVRTSCRVESITWVDGQWRAQAADGSVTTAEALVLAVPAPQALRLLPADSPLCSQVAAVRMTPCWAAMVTFEDRVPLDLDGAFVSSPEISWAARNGSKPERPTAESWVLHATAEWSQEHFDDPREAIAEALVAALGRAAGVALPAVRQAAAHRWGFAQASEGVGADHLLERDRWLGVCGDWCPGSRVEGAFLSGTALAGALLRRAAAEPWEPPTEPSQTTLPF